MRDVPAFPSPAIAPLEEHARPDASEPWSNPMRPSGVNAIASWAATTGLTEAARRSVAAMLRAGVPVAIEDYDYGAPREDQRFPSILRSLPQGRRFDIDIYFLNVNELHVVPDDYLRARARYIIGSWFWELPSVARHDLGQLDRVDEIWAATEFVASTFRARTSRPVTVLPCVVEPTPDPTFSRRNLGLPASKFLFLYGYDASFAIERKNPRAVIEAFELAFTADERREKVHLAMKTSHLARLPEAHALVTAELARAGGTLIDEDLTDGEMAALTQQCDVYVSLHRAEGFGLGIAEAMYFGRPVVATAYSGNMDFMSNSNSCPVSYRMQSISRTDLRLNPGSESVYIPGELWAEPDVLEAARRMRFLYEHPRFRQAVGDAGARTIRERFSSLAVGRQMRERLEECTQRLTSPI